MTSTPVSLNDESLNGSWVDINSASQINSPIDNDSPEYLRPPHAVAESVQNLGIISFQVERFLREAQRQSDGNNTANDYDSQQHVADNISDMCLSDSDLSADGLQESKSLIDNLRMHNKRKSYASNNNNGNLLIHTSPELIGERLSKSGECILDQVSDSLSMLSRASLGHDGSSFRTVDLTRGESQYEDFDWLWDWTAQPEFFTGKEWKVTSVSQQELLLNRHKNQHRDFDSNKFTGDVMSLLFITNILSIIIGAGLTYSILMRKATV